MCGLNAIAESLVRGGPPLRLDPAPILMSHSCRNRFESCGRVVPFMCAAAPMLKAVLAMLEGLGVSSQRIAFDDFGV